MDVPWRTAQVLWTGIQREDIETPPKPSRSWRLFHMAPSPLRYLHYKIRVSLLFSKDENVSMVSAPRCSPSRRKPLKEAVHIAATDNFSTAMIRFRSSVCLPPTGVTTTVFLWVCWSLWKDRNLLIFENKPSQPSITPWQNGGDRASASEHNNDQDRCGVGLQQMQGRFGMDRLEWWRERDQERIFSTGSRLIPSGSRGACS